ncbi:Cupredoxin [Mollisia scopiformis]|uniref:Cupredoxin n=1 Tax=Mollisia scopiformis TaxID=149040 RepID=A0A132B9N0_MOLSC|nr:Cupredoxin [Mollisia scopiformis]KUJ08953.1 Cupredoxin [Mollisia scopiformis]
MFYSALAIVLSALPLAFAQYGNDPASTTSSSPASVSTTSSGATVHVIKVGDGALAFSPNNITAAVNDIVEFHFYPAKHSVAQSTFADPCVPLTNGTSFFSGSMSTTSGVNVNTFQLTINNTAPIWFYCAYPGHCEQGMAGVINQATTGTKTLDAYIAAAANVNSTVAPSNVQGGVIAAALAGSSTGTSSTTGTSTSTSSTSTSTSKSAGVETKGAIRWMLLGFTGAVAVGVGSLMV